MQYARQAKRNYNKKTSFYPSQNVLSLCCYAIPRGCERWSEFRNWLPSWLSLSMQHASQVKRNYNKKHYLTQVKVCFRFVVVHCGVEFVILALDFNPFRAGVNGVA